MEAAREKMFTGEKINFTEVFIVKQISAILRVYLMTFCLKGPEPLHMSQSRSKLSFAITAPVNTVKT